MVWPCARCGKELNEVDNHPLTKYCKPCRHKNLRERQRRAYQKRKKEPSESMKSRLLYLLKTNKMATDGEIAAFTGLAQKSIKQVVFQLRQEGHDIKKKRFGMYYYVA